MANIVSRVQDMYLPEWRFLESFERDGNVFSGSFEVPFSPYLKDRKKINHVTEVELDVCLSQLCYSSIASLFEVGRFGDSKGLSDFLEIQGEGVLTGISNKKFRRSIPHGKFDGYVVLDEDKCSDSMLIYSGNFADKSILVGPFAVLVNLKDK